VTIRDRLRAVIQRSGLSLREFAEGAGLPYRSVQDYARGVSKPGTDAVVQICTGYRVSADWLLTGQGDMYRSDATLPGGVRDGAASYARAPPAAAASAAAVDDAREDRDRPDAGGRLPREADQISALERELEGHWTLLRRMCADEPDYPGLLAFLVWLFDWWEAVGPEDHAWLLGQLRRHIPDWSDPAGAVPTDGPAPPGAAPGH
jgi:transcriptional regulator with XRE-family HTH domain